MVFKLVNVRGDGNCYYRCVWNLVKKESEDVKAAVGLVGDVATECDGVRMIRKFVARTLGSNDIAQTSLRNMWELSGVIDMSEEFPLANRVKRYKNWETVLRNSCNFIETTSIMASQIEHSIIKYALAAVGIGLVVLSRTEEDGTLADLGEKWLYQLNVLLPKIDAPSIALLVNEDYIHYKYIRFNGATITSHVELYTFINDCITSDTDDDEA